MRRLVVLGLVVALLGAGATSAWAQVGRAELRGRVVDQQGGALPGVLVTITNQDTGTFREVITGGEGDFFAAQLIPGTFTITATLTGFSTFQRTDFAVGVGRTADIDIEMAIGGVEETITVSGEAPLVDLTSAEVGGTVSAGELVDLPTGNRSYFSAVALLPGIQFSPLLEPGERLDDRQRTDAGGQLRGPGRWNEQRRRERNRGGWSGARPDRVGVGVPGPDEPVRRGVRSRPSGAIVNSITKQGTNQFTGARVQLLHQRRHDVGGLLRPEQRESGEAGDLEEGVWWHHRRADHPG